MLKSVLEIRLLKLIELLVYSFFKCIFYCAKSKISNSSKNHISTYAENFQKKIIICIIKEYTIFDSKHCTPEFKQYLICGSYVYLNFIFKCCLKYFIEKIYSSVVCLYMKSKYPI